MNDYLAKRLEKFDSSKIRTAFELAKDIPNSIDLSIGFPEDDTPKYIKSAGIKAINEGRTRYTPSNGILELRQVIADKLRTKNQIETDAENITITPGVTTGIMLAYMATLDRGDEVLLPDPFFPPYKDLALLLGAVPKLIDTAPSFQLTAKLLEPHITPKTKLLIINSPNNPSGAIYPEGELRKIAALAKKHKLLIISDEIYENFSYDIKHFSIGSIYPNTLTLNGFSKGYAMTGWRIGYINGPSEIIKGINELQQYMVFSSSSIGQYAALEAFRYGTDKMVCKYVKKRDHSAEILSQAFPDICGAQGAFYFFLKLPIDITDVGFVNHMAHRGVVVLPGSAFSQHKDYIRISFAAETKNLNKGLELICESINHILQPDNIKLRKA